MLEEGRIAMTEEETAAVEKLRSENPDASISFTREGEMLLVHVDYPDRSAEDASYLVGADGKRKKVA